MNKIEINLLRNNMKNIFKYVLILAFGFFVPTTILANTAEQDIKVLMELKTKNFYTIINDKNLDDNMQKKKVLEELSPLFDFNLMARLALNKKIWKSINKEQRAAFSTIFISRVQKSYLDKLDVFKDIKLKIKESKRVKKNRIEVIGLLKTKADTKKLVYKFYLNKKGKWLIYDISIVGVSFLQSYRSQFSAYLKKNSFDDLLNKLKNTKEEL
jgi:phospholipid transport system substrate-binding protein